jgi:hypothetical protein
MAPNLAPQVPRESLDASGIGNVELVKCDVVPFARENPDRGAPLGRIARGQDDRVAAPRQLPEISNPDPAIGAGHHRDAPHSCHNAILT